MHTHTRLLFFLLSCVVLVVRLWIWLFLLVSFSQMHLSCKQQRGECVGETVGEGKGSGM